MLSIPQMFTTLVMASLFCQSFASNITQSALWSEATRAAQLELPAAFVAQLVRTSCAVDAGFGHDECARACACVTRTPVVSSELDAMAAPRGGKGSEVSACP